MDGLERMDKPRRWPVVAALVVMALICVGIVWGLRCKSAAKPDVPPAPAAPAMVESAGDSSNAIPLANSTDRTDPSDLPDPTNRTDEASRTNQAVSTNAPAPSPAMALAAEAEALLAAGRKDKAREKYLAALVLNPEPALRVKIEEVLGPLNVELIRNPWPMPEKQDVVVQPGDSVKAFARKFGTTVELIVKGNGLKRPDVIRPGQHLKVYGGKMAITVNKARNELLLTSNGAFFRRYKVGTGRYDKTPVGTFVVTERIPEPPWWRDDGRTVPFGDKENILGTRWMAIKATGATPEIKGYGIHGTWDTNSIGKAESAGCIRLRNEDVEELFELIPVGTPVVIEE